MTEATHGYSGTPLHRKLGVRPADRVLAVGVPSGWDVRRLDPDGSATVQTRPGRTPYDVVVVFCPDQAALRARLATALPRVTERGRLWLCWPKRASGVVTDVDEGQVRALGLAAGVVDVKVCAVDDVWSGLCFMRRRRPQREHSVDSSP